jgi:MFS family permease
MFGLRFFAGPLAHKFNPLGLLMLCSLLAAAGLFWVGQAGGAAIAIFVAATLYAAGKTFFWPTTLAVVSEQFPRGGALTLNAIGGMGMIAVGVLGGPMLGTMLDRSIDKALLAEAPALHATVTRPPETNFFIEYQAVDKKLAEALPAADKATIGGVRVRVNQSILSKVAILPVIMALVFGGLTLYYRSRGGYKAVQLQ